jgi:hypothetical protein
MEFYDFFAFILGSLAGFSFLSRISKYICEKCNVFNKSLADYVELNEEFEGGTKTDKQLELNKHKN